MIDPGSTLRFDSLTTIAQSLVGAPVAHHSSGSEIVGAHSGLLDIMTGASPLVFGIGSAILTGLVIAAVRHHATRTEWRLGRRLQEQLEAMPDAVALFNAKGRLTASNGKLARFLCGGANGGTDARVALNDATPDELYARLSCDDEAVTRARERAIANATDPDATLSFELPGHGERPVLIKERPIDAGGRAVSVYHAPFTTRTQRRKDPLTGLASRAHLVAMITERCRRTPLDLTLLIVELRSFRQINETFGRSAGDELLKATAASLRHFMPDHALCARTGGDEFAIMVDGNCDRDDIEARTDRFLASLSRGLKVSDAALPVRASAGVAYGPEHGSTVTELLTSADSACSQAKRLGNNKLMVFNSDHQQRARHQHRLEVGLQNAIERKELLLHYQPQIELEHGLTCGMEALLRWNSRQLGRVSPAEFIPVAEHSGIIRRLGAWVLETAIADYQRLEAYGMEPLILSVNISRKQFDNGRIVDDILAVCDARQFDPRRLCLEITETALSDDIAGLRRILQALAEVGTKLAIDDFGVGYSSLLELRDFPISEVKIDRAFIDDIASDHRSQDIVAAVVSIASSIGATVVAEGIENAEQLEIVRNLGCHRAQGYHVCEPMAATNFPDVVLSA